MTVDKIIEALRCTSAPGGPIEDCGKCPFLKTEKLTTEQAKQLGTDNWTSCDIEEFPIAVTKRRFGTVEEPGDMGRFLFPCGKSEL